MMENENQMSSNTSENIPEKTIVIKMPEYSEATDKLTNDSGSDCKQSTIQTDVVPESSENIIEYSDTTHDMESEKESIDNLSLNEVKRDVSSGMDKSINSSQSGTITNPSLVFDNVKMLTGAWNEFCPKKSEFGEAPVFLKGCKWSPDGTCLLTNSDDATMRLFDLPLELYNCHCLPDIEFQELKPSLKTKIGSLVYDYCWYPQMTSMAPETCCFVTTSANSPVQMWDAFSGSLRCSYRGYNLQDEMHAALSVAFDPAGDLVLCGYKDSVKIFHTDVPGRDFTVISTKGACEQKGLVSCISVNPSMPNIFAAGTYTKSVGLYSVDGHGMCLLTGQSGGITQVMFTKDGSRLLAAGRKDSEILCWDLRQLGQVLAVMRRPHTTNQRVYMDLSPDDQFLLSGSADGQIYVWNLHSTTENSVLQPAYRWQAHNDCANGLSVHRHVPIVATASGQRYFPDVLEGEDEDLVFATKRPQDRCEESVKLWWLGNVKGPEVHMQTGNNKREEL